MCTARIFLVFLVVTSHYVKGQAFNGLPAFFASSSGEGDLHVFRLPGFGFNPIQTNPPLGNFNFPGFPQLPGFPGLPFSNSWTNHTSLLEARKKREAVDQGEDIPDSEDPAADHVEGAPSGNPQNGTPEQHQNRLFGFFYHFRNNPVSAPPAPDN